MGTSNPVEHGPAQDMLFLSGDGVESLQQAIAQDIVYPSVNAMGLLAYYRPLMQEQVFRHRRTLPKSKSASQFYDSLRVSEEAIRQGVVRGAGDLAVSSMAQWSIDTIAGSGTSLVGFSPPKEMSRGRVFVDKDAAYVQTADTYVRRACESTIAATFRFDSGYVMSAFRDSSERIRSLAKRTLDLYLGKGWRDLDHTEAARLAPIELNGRQLSRYERHLLLKPHKNLSLETAVSNAASTAAELTVSSMLDVGTALALNYYPKEALFPVLFANIHKISMVARLPFWPAHRVSENTKNGRSNNIFRAIPDSYHTGVIEVTHPWFRNYFEKGAVGTCQGVRPSTSPLIVNDRVRRRRIGHLIDLVQEIATVDGQKLPLDIPEHQLDPPNLTSVQAATILALSVAFADARYKK